MSVNNPNSNPAGGQINNNYNLPQIKAGAADIRSLSPQLVVFELLKVFSIQMDISTLNRTILNEALALTGGVFAALIHIDEETGGVKYIQKSNGAFEKKKSVPNFYLNQKTPIFAEIKDGAFKNERYGDYNYMLIAPFYFCGRAVCVLEIFYEAPPGEKKAADTLRLISLFEKCCVLAIVNSLIKTHNFEITKHNYSDSTRFDKFNRPNVALSRLTFASYVGIISELLFISCPCEFCSILWFDKKNISYRIVAEKTIYENGGEKILSNYREKSVKLIKEAVNGMSVISLAAENAGGASELKNKARQGRDSVVNNYLAAPVMNFKQSSGGIVLINKLSHKSSGVLDFNYNDQLTTLILTNYLGDFYGNFVNTATMENKVRSLSIIYSLAGASGNLFELSDFERSIKKTLKEISRYMKIHSSALVFYDAGDKNLKIYSSLDIDISKPIASLLASINMDFWTVERNYGDRGENDSENVIKLSEVNIFTQALNDFKVEFIKLSGAADSNLEISVKPVRFHGQLCGYMLFIDSAGGPEAGCGFILDESGPEMNEFMSAASNILLSMIKAQKNYIKLNELEKLASRMERLASIGEVAAGVAHEIRNPLGGISLFATSLAAGFDENDSRKKWLNQIIEAVGRIGKIVSSLLNYSREEIIVKACYNAVVLVSESIAAVNNDLNYSSGGRGIKCGFYKASYPAINSGAAAAPLAFSEKIMVNCDAEKIKQVFLNLALNSLNAFCSGGSETAECEIDIIFARDEANARLFIYFCDNGPGVPEDIKDKIFRPFFTSRSKGTGLGLAIVQKIVEAHSGSVRLIDSGGLNAFSKKYGAIFELGLPD
jgi:signal transduction histidine kinase